ncbi:hypothetical protein FRC17_011311 [Serendipita sp. 399]|nr:hypothetical protein FRC17_011311 [Serendipita sp. 399]
MAAQTEAHSYRGEEKIIVSIDLGTTHRTGAVSFAHAYPGSDINVRMVTRWKGQPEAAGDSKIPTIVAYKDGQLVACGAEARDYLGDEEYEVSKWFKLHLHPDSMGISDAPPPYGSDTNTMEIPELPTNVSLLMVYSDFMRYLFEGFISFFEESTPNGAAIWRRLSSGIVIILTIPNGWDTRQQGFLKQVAQLAGVVQSDDDAALRIEFVSEGEASVHYVLGKINHNTWLGEGVMFAVTDAGGSTVDSTLYVCKRLEPKLVLEEVCASECVQVSEGLMLLPIVTDRCIVKAGGVFVDRAAQHLLVEKLTGSNYADEGTIGDMVHKFEQRTKRVFDGTQESNVIDFGSRRDNDRDYNIIQGKITLTRSEVSSMFDNVVARSVASCSKLLHRRNIKHLLLVGGFGESPFLRSRLREEFGNRGTEIVTVEEPSKKAAAEGAVLWYTKQMVAARIARFTMGIAISCRFDAHNEEHMRRRHLADVDARGDVRLPGAFKNQRIAQNHSDLSTFTTDYSEKPESLENLQRKILAWEGDGIPEWTRDAKGM